MNKKTMKTASKNGLLTKKRGICPSITTEARSCGQSNGIDNLSTCHCLSKSLLKDEIINLIYSNEINSMRTCLSGDNSIDESWHSGYNQCIHHQNQGKPCKLMKSQQSQQRGDMSQHGYMMHGKTRSLITSINHLYKRNQLTIDVAS